MSWENCSYVVLFSSYFAISFWGCAAGVSHSHVVVSDNLVKRSGAFVYIIGLAVPGSLFARR